MWVFPALLAFAPKMARSVLDYRISRMNVAANAAKESGFQGKKKNDCKCYSKHASTISNDPTLLLPYIYNITDKSSEY